MKYFNVFIIFSIKIQILKNNQTLLLIIISPIKNIFEKSIFMINKDQREKPGGILFSNPPDKLFLKR